MASGSGLRERQREETRRLIQRAALELSAELGYRKVTVEAISARAGISPRTFFNHVPTKEAAIVLDPPVKLRDEYAARFAAGGVATPQELLVELTRALVDQLETDPPDRTQSERILTIAIENPEVFATMVGQLEAVRRDLSLEVARRLPEDADPQVADLIASLAMAAVRSGLEAWARDESPHRDGTPVAFVRRAADIIVLLTGRSAEEGSPAA